MSAKELWVVVALSGVAICAAAQSQPTDAQIDAAFKKLDSGADGTLSAAEAGKLGITRRTFTEANPDKDATLDRKEFRAALSIQFKRANPDGDGTLDWKEAKKAGIRSKAVFQAADPDKDGTLDLAEYLAALLAQMK